MVPAGSEEWLILPKKPFKTPWYFHKTHAAVNMSSNASVKTEVLCSPSSPAAGGEKPSEISMQNRKFRCHSCFTRIPGLQIVHGHMRMKKGEGKILIVSKGSLSLSVLSIV